MKPVQFYQALALTIVVSIVAVWSMSYWPAVSDYLNIGWIEIAVFAPLMIALFYMGQRAVQSSNKSRYIQFAMVASFLKIMICAAIILLYALIVRPTSRLFIMPAIGVYVVFTIFEMIFMLRLSRS